MFRALVLQKRKSGTTMSEFVTAYEASHAPRVAESLVGLKRYIRYYLYPAPYPLYGAVVDPAYDLLSELWFEDRAAYDDAMAQISSSDTFELLSEDVRTLLDPNRVRYALIDEYETSLGGPAPDRERDIRCFVLLKRRPDLTMAQFIDYYENNHQKLGAKYSGELMNLYRRLYLTPLPDVVDGTVIEADYDVVTEISFPDKESALRSKEMMDGTDAVRVLDEDEKNFMDQSVRAFAYASIKETELPQVHVTA